MKLPVLFFAVCCVALFAACSKGKIDSPVEQLLVDGRWQLSGITATISYMGLDTTFDAYPFEKDCTKDDVIRYRANNKGTVEEGANVCPGHSKTSDFEWGLLDNDTRMYAIDDNPDTADLEVNSTQMKLKLKKTNSSGSVTTAVYTYKNIN